jgi:hypothetical protein
MEHECNQLFIEAKERQAKTNSPHPSEVSSPITWSQITPEIEQSASAFPFCFGFVQII